MLNFYQKDVRVKNAITKRAFITIANTPNGLMILVTTPVSAKATIVCSV